MSKFYYIDYNKMGNILNSFKQTAIVVKERVCGMYDLFGKENELHETVITNFDFQPFDVDTHYRNAEFYYSDDLQNAKIR